MYLVPGIILDPFMGAGTTAIEAKDLARDFVGIELNEEYIKMTDERLLAKRGVFHESIFANI